MAGPAAAPRRRLVAVLGDLAANTRLRSLLLGSTAWGTGEAAYIVGLTIVVFEMGGTDAVALLAVVRALPSVVFAPVLSGLLSRIEPDAQLRAVLALRVAIVAVMTLDLGAAAGSTAVLLVLAGVDSIAATQLRPIRSALVPALARSPEELVAANVGITSGDSAAALVGPAAAAVLLLVAGPVPTFVVGTLLLAAAFAGSLRLHEHAQGAAAPRERDPRGRAGHAAIAGLRDLARLPHARLIVALFVTQRFVRGALAVLVVSTAVEVVGMGDAGVGWLSAAIGLGGVAGGAVALGLVSRRRLAPAFLAGIAIWGAGLGLPGAIPIAAVALAAFAAAGLGKVVLDVAGVSLLQRTVPLEQRGRVLGALEGLVSAALAAGPIAAALLIEWIGPAWALLAIGALPVVAVALAWLPLRSADEAAMVPERALRLLRQVPLFQPLGLNAIERVAGAVAWREVPAGATVVAESELGDRFYVIESGRFSVTAGGRALRDLGPGDSFGEIALLHARPRTATVTAAEPGVLAAIAGPAFLDAINGHRESAAAAEAQACERLLARLS